MSDRVDMPNTFDLTGSAGYMKPSGFMTAVSFTQLRTLGGGDIRGLALADVGADLLLRLQRDADVLVGQRQRGAGGDHVTALHRREQLRGDRGVVLAVGLGRARG